MEEKDSMANSEHLARLVNRRPVDEWNAWRTQQREVKPDLSGADLHQTYHNHRNLMEANLDQANLTYAHLNNVNLGRASLKNATLHRAHLVQADLSNASLEGADLTKADLTEAILTGALNSFSKFTEARMTWASLRGSIFRGADFSGADLSYTTLSGCDFRDALFREANLHGADFTNANLQDADFTGATFRGTSLCQVDLRAVKGLESIIHSGPSSLGIDTIYLSEGALPRVFLQGMGLPDLFIDYVGSLLGQPLQYHSCFISYSSKDQEFAERLYTDLQSKGVRCWYAPEDIKIGDEFRSRIDQAIHIHDRLLLILSEHSVTSRWVQKEVETAFEKEEKEQRFVLFPVRLDTAVLESTTGWAADVRRQRHIGDFTRWKEHDIYQKAFARLLRDLQPAMEKEKKGTSA